MFNLTPEFELKDVTRGEEVNPLFISSKFVHLQFGGLKIYPLIFYSFSISSPPFSLKLESTA
jgi:hypothetical protein